jgi:hypothetical protein
VSARSGRACPKRHTDKWRPKSTIRLAGLPRDAHELGFALNDPTKQDDKPALPYTLTLRAFQRLAAKYRAQRNKVSRASPAAGWGSSAGR